MPRRGEKRKEGPGKMTREEAGKNGGEATEETPGQESYQEMGKKSGAAPKGAAKGEAAEKGEVTVRLSGKELEITFSSQEESEEWRNRFEQVMGQEGYRLTQKKPEAVRSEAGAAAGE
jgi:hypothetical protein